MLGPAPPQIFYLSLFIFGLALVGVFYPYNRGALYTALIVLYALTACIAGYVGASYYRQVGWVQGARLAGAAGWLLHKHGACKGVHLVQVDAGAAKPVKWVPHAC